MSRITTPRPVQNKNQIAMHELLLRACPANKQERKSIGKLAETLGLSSWAVYSWIKVERIPARWVTKLVKVSKKHVTAEEVLKFVIG